MTAKGFSVERVRHNESVDYILISLIVLLLGIGVSILFSASYYYAEKLFGDPLYFFKKQLIWIGLGVVGAVVLSRLDLEKLRKFIPWIILLAFVLTVLTFVPGIGREVLGARRWIYVFGLSFQPSELVKLALILYLAHIFSKKADRIETDPASVLVPPFILVVLFTALIYMQNDFSTAAFIFLISAFMFFIARVRLLYFLLFGTVIVPFAGILLFTKEHRVKRIIAFLNPEMDPLGTGYQVIASESALINGGIWGKGLGEGAKKLGGLPEAYSDFVFAVLGEEMGFIGILAVLGLFIAFALRSTSISINSESKFGYYLGLGITACIFWQSLLNIAVVGGIVPATGIPLPFFSAGGSLMVITLCMCGLLLNLSHNWSNQSREGSNV